MPGGLRVILIKPSKYARDGCVERFRWGFMPNSTLAHLRSLTPPEVDGASCDVTAVDEYVQTDLSYLSLLQRDPERRTLLALVGVQSHQFHRALDLAALARRRGVEACIIGGPHPMTCNTSALHGRGISFAMAEAEIAWPAILRDALHDSLQPVYGADHGWQETLEPPPLIPLPKRDLRRYAVPMLGIYPARGCPFTCNFCSVIQIAGRRIRSQPVETTMASLRAAKAAGVKLVMFTTDNFNKYPEAPQLLEAMIAENLRLPFFAQCDAQIYREPELVQLMARAGCFQMFVGVESFRRDTLKAAHKMHNRPDHYAEIIALCRKHGITTHFSNILGFPDDTEESIVEHLDVLRRMAPDVSSFYILTPIPGTEQYDEFRAQGLITEANLDRFDGTQVTWRHPHLTAAQLHGMLLRCYREFFKLRDVIATTARVAVRITDFRLPAEIIAVPGYAVQSRLAARRGDHPMAGGTWRVRLDCAADYAELRRDTYGLEQVELPDSLRSSRKQEMQPRRREGAELHKDFLAL